MFPWRRVAVPVLSAGILTAALVSPASAGGLYLNEFGTPSMGTAGAGAQAWANDASTSFHNPAGMTRLEGNQIMSGNGLLQVNAEFDKDDDTPINGGNGGDAGGFGPILGLFGVADVTDDFKIGANVISTSAAILDYDNDWTGRFQNQEVKLLTVSINPTVAYQVTDWLSLGAGFTAMYAKLDFKIAVPGPMGEGQAEIDGDDWAFGYNFGAMVEPTEQTRFGVIYQSKIEPDFQGDLKLDPVNLEVGSDLELTFPQMVRVAAYHDINDQWAVLGTVGWEDWSEMEKLLVSTGKGTQSIRRDWNDTFHFSGGVHYRPWTDWLFQAGITYDTSPTTDAKRTADMPIDRQIRYAVGVQHQLNENLNVGGAFQYADYGKAKIDNDQTLKGDYKTNEIFFFALNLNYKF